MSNTFCKTKPIFSIIAITALSFFNQGAYAISYPSGDDCTGTDITSCAHPNILMVSGFGKDGLTVVGTRCTASLIQKPTANSNKYVFLTAAHCAFAWQANPAIANLGISFDPNVAGNGNVVDISHFVVGPVGSAMIPVINNYIKTNTQLQKDVGILSNDYGIVAFVFKGADPIAAKWPAIVNIPPVTLPQDVNFSLQNLVDSSSNPKNILFSAVGYGLTELKPAPGSKNIPDIDTSLGTKRDGLTQSFTNLRNTILDISQNPAQGFNGTCFGDSGGPNYYTDPVLGEIVVGVTSQGDAVCRAMGTNARLDIPNAITFISCIRNASTVTALKSCGQ
jgi:hypothetical protein